MATHYDCLVVGAGPVGAATAALLGTAGLHTALLDHRRPEMPDAAFDPRVVAVSPGSRNVLQAAGGWQHIPASRICAFSRMRVECGNGQIHFLAGEHGLDELGWIAEIPALQAGLWRAMETRAEVELVAPVRIVGAALDQPVPELELDDGRRVQASLIIAADGVQSWLRQQAGITTELWHYNQRAIVCHLDIDGGCASSAHPHTTHDPFNRCAWQRFTDHGPLALLPLPEERYSLVWSLPEDIANELMALDDAAFLQRLTESSDAPFGTFTSATRRFAFPLRRQRAQSLTGRRLALVGDAGRSVHPLAGQGMNLGLADAAAIVECLDGWDPGQDPSPRLDRYRRWRGSAGELMAGGIHAINEWFAVRAGPMQPLRALGLRAVGALWPARERFVRHACGLDDDAPQLCRVGPH